MESALDRLQTNPEELQLSTVKEAVDGYRGSFLDGCYDDWCLEERDRYQDGFLNLLRYSATALLKQRNFTGAEPILRQIIKNLPWDENSHRKLMSLYQALGRKNDAIKQYQACKEILAREFDMAPDTETKELLDMIRSDSAEKQEAANEIPVIGAITENRTPAIAVLPFSDLSPDSDQQFFSDGLTEELISALTRVRALRVISRSSCYALQDQNLSLIEIGQRLNVNSVVDGSVRHEGDQIRITARLSDVAADSLLWTETFDRTIKDVFSLQDEITHAIVNALKIKLLGRADRGFSRPTSYQAAYHHYLRGRYYWNSRGEENLLKSVEYFTKASEADANYAPSFSGLADAYSLLGYYHYLPREKAFSQARETAQHALMLDETLPQAHLSLGLLLDYNYEWDKARDAYRRALQLNPGSATAHHWYGLFQMNQTQFDEAQRSIERAHALDPLSVAVNRDFGQVFYYSGKSTEAKSYLEDAIEMNPHFPLTHLYLGFVYLQQGAIAEAKSAFETEHEIAGQRDLTAQLMLLYIEARQGELQDFDPILKGFQQDEVNRFIPNYYVALIYFALEQNQRALDALMQARLKHDFSLSRLNVDPLFVSYRQSEDLPDLFGFLP
jgi:TolB-like protein/Tfp pilus assembly protein PilF